MVSNVEVTVMRVRTPSVSKRTRCSPAHPLVLEHSVCPSPAAYAVDPLRSARPRPPTGVIPDPPRALQRPVALELLRGRRTRRSTTPSASGRARAARPRCRGLRRPRSTDTLFTPARVRCSTMCFPFDAIVPELPEGFQVIAGGAPGERLDPDLGRRHRFQRLPRRAPTGRPASSCCPMCAACSVSTSSSPSASPPPGTRRSRSTTSAAPPGSARATTTSSTCPTSQQTTPETVALDVDAAVARSRDRAPSLHVTVGFCFGGAQSFMPATYGHAGLAGVVGFYGLAQARGQRWTLDRAPRDQDPGARPVRRRRPEHHARPGRRVRRRSLPVEHEIHTYPGAPHSFFDRRQEQYSEASPTTPGGASSASSSSAS